MYRSYDANCGLPPRIYRLPAEIKRDIMDIRRRIEETADMINVRSLLIDILVGDSESEPERLIPELYDAIVEANTALGRLGELKEELSLLEEELGEVRCMLKA